MITLGNWVWGQRDFAPYLSGTDRVLRPANLSPKSPGRGLAVHDGVAVINLPLAWGFGWGVGPLVAEVAVGWKARAECGSTM